MNKPLSVGEYVRSGFSGPRAVTLAFAISLMGCMAPQVSTTQPIKNSFSSEQTEGEDTDIDNPVFIALTGISREVQAGIGNPEESSLQFIWEYASKRLKEIKIHEPVSVALTSPHWNDGFCSYAVIEVAGQKAFISAKDEKTAMIKTREAQQFCIEYFRYRIEISLGGNHATEDQLREIIENEKGVFIKHRMTLPNVKKTRDGSWDIVFHAEI